MPPTPITLSEPLLRESETHSVYVKEHWQDDWDLEPHLFCNHLTFTASPTISSAELESRYGQGRRQFDSQFGQADYLDRAGWWVKIEILFNYDEEREEFPDPIVWVGRIAEDHDNLEGSLEDQPAGVQRLLAYGVEILLEREIIFSSWFAGEDGPQRVGRGLVFNDLNHVRSTGGLDHKFHADRPGNRAVYQADDAKLFAGDLSSSLNWSTRDIAEYLLARQTPKIASGEAVVPFILDNTAAEYLPDWDKPVIAQHGRSLREVLNELMDRRRLLGYALDFDAEAEQFILRPFTFADEDVDVGEEKIVFANADQYTLLFDQAVDVAQAQVKESEAQRYDQVIASGARIVCCGSISSIEGTLDKHWGSTQETAYCTAASGQPDYAGLEESEKAYRDKLFRTADELRRVYCYFGLPDDWDGQIGDGENGVAADLLPAEVPDFQNFEDAAWYPGELRFLPELPLKTDHDYSGAKIADDEVADNTPAGAPWHYRPPLALLKLPDAPGDQARYCEVQKISQCADVELIGDGAGYGFSCSVAVQPDGPGIALRVSGDSVGQHEIAKADFIPLDAERDPAGSFDWRNNLIVTFAMEADCHVEARWPETAPDTLDPLRILRIDATRTANHPEAAAGLHYVAPGTVVDVSDGKLVRSTSGGLVRDDRDLLSRIARAAYEWYGRRRQAMTLTYQRISNDFCIGDLITGIGDGETAEPIRSVVTEIRYDLAQSDRETHKTTLQTQWAELDVLKLF